MSLHHEKPNIPGYEIIEKIGEGGMANVYMARQTRQDRMIAMKVLKFGLSDNASSASEDRERFRIEAQGAARISHPNIVQVIDFGEHEGHTYIIMEYVPGCTIAELLELRHAINEKDAFAICSELADALDYCWKQHKMIHCDIKPDNVIVHSDGTIKLADLGLARVKGFSAVNSDDETVLGTPNYISPEQALDEVELDCRADIYSLGASLYHMLTGVVPFQQHDPEEVVQQQLDGQLTDPWEINQTIPPPFIWLMEKMMAKDRDQRQADWIEVAEDFETAMRGCLINNPIDTSDASTIARHPDRPSPEPLKKRVRRSSSSPDLKAKSDKPKRKVLISDEDKRKIDRQHHQHLRDETPRALTILGMSVVVAVMLYGWSMLAAKNPSPEMQAALVPIPQPRPTIEPPSPPVLDRIEHNSAEEQENMAAVTAEIKNRLNRKPGPRPPRPKPRPADASTDTARGPVIPVGPMPTRPLTPGSRPTIGSFPGSNPPAANTQPAPPAQKPEGSGGRWDSAEFKAARLKIIDARKEFYYLVQGQGERGRLKKIEQDAREAIAELKKIQGTAPDSADIDRYITSAYKLISDCHQATRL